MTLRRRLALAVLLAACPVANAHAATGADAIATLNAQRVANGIPADIAEREDWSAACGDHAGYMLQNNVLTHDEDPDEPGYTKDGAWAGHNSVLAAGASWDAGNPFETAPLHLFQLMAPRLTEMGAAESAGWICDTTWPGMRREHPEAAKLYTYPGDGRTDVAAAETAAESPFVPGDFVGLPQGTTTGPNILVLADGPWDSAKARIEAASLTGPDGPVEVRWVDSTSETIGPYLTSGAILIPVAPLQANAPYTASVEATVAGDSVSRTWSFTTAADQPAPDVTTKTRRPAQGTPVSSSSASPDGRPVTSTRDPVRAAIPAVSGPAAVCRTARGHSWRLSRSFKRHERRLVREYRRLMRWHWRLHRHGGSHRSFRAYARARRRFIRHVRAQNHRRKRLIAARGRVIRRC